MASFSREPTVSQTVEWFTPMSVFGAMGVMFDMDVASPGAHKAPWVPARRHLTRAEDGLSTPWIVSGGAARRELAFVWMNPPYGRGLRDWVVRFVDHAEGGGSGVAMLFNRSENSWYRTLEKAPGLLALFIHGRVKFVSPEMKTPGTAGAGSVLFGVGTLGRTALLNAKHAGLGTLWAPCHDTDPRSRQRS